MRHAMHRRRGRLDRRCPINWDWEGNAGLVGEWAVAPVWGQFGSLTVRDMTRGHNPPNDGELNGGVTWQGTSRAGGYGQLTSDGTGYVNCGNHPAWDFGTGDFTCAFWVILTQAMFNAGAGLAGKGNYRTDGWYFNAFIFSGNFAEFAVGDGATFSHADWVNPPLNVWSHIIGTRRGGNIYLYGNGKLIDGPTASTQNMNSSTFNLFLNNNSSGVFPPGATSYDDMGVWNVGFTDAAAAALYDQTRRGNPDRWRWMSRTAWFLPAGGASPTLDEEGMTFAVYTGW